MGLLLVVGAFQSGYCLSVPLSILFKLLLLLLERINFARKFLEFSLNTTFFLFQTLNLGLQVFVLFLEFLVFGFLATLAAAKIFQPFAHGQLIIARPR